MSHLRCILGCRVAVNSMSRQKGLTHTRHHRHLHATSLRPAPTVSKSAKPGSCCVCYHYRQVSHCLVCSESAAACKYRTELRLHDLQSVTTALCWTRCSFQSTQERKEKDPYAVWRHCRRIWTQKHAVSGGRGGGCKFSYVGHQTKSSTNDCTSLKKHCKTVCSRSN